MASFNIFARIKFTMEGNNEGKQEVFRFYDVKTSSETRIESLKEYVQKGEQICFLLNKDNFKLYLSVKDHISIYRDGVDPHDDNLSGYFKVVDNKVFFEKSGWHKLDLEDINLIRSILEEYLKENDLL